MLNTILTIVSALVLAGVLTFLYIKRKNECPEVVLQDKMTLDKLIAEVKVILADKFKDEFFFGKDDAEWEEAYAQKQRLQRASKQCVYGVDSAKITVRGLIKSILRTKLKTEEAVAQIIDFNGDYLDPLVKWEILLYYVKKEKGKDAVRYIMSKYNWYAVKNDIEDGETPIHGASDADLDAAYAGEVRGYIPYGDQLDILAIIVFAKYKGFGCIDTLREMNIDGINCGVSGSILANSQMDDSAKAPRSVWVYDDGKYIHLRFLTFYTEDELRRVTLLVCRYNSPGPLTEKRGFIINTMYDQSRVLAIRPNAGEYWAFMLRKFTIKDIDLEKLYIKEGDPTNAQLPLGVIKYLMKSLIVTAFTGRQGCGKTTMMIGAVKYFDGRYNIGVVEATPEMYLRERYPNRNMYSVAENQYISMEHLQDAIKKGDRGITIIGEVATSPVAARFIQIGQVGSETSIISHHGKRAKDVVYSLRNSLAEAGNFNNLLVAEQQVVDVLRIDVHCTMDVYGFRYIERITEIVKLDESVPYPEIDPDNIELSMARITREHYYRETDRTCFATVDLVVFNKKTMKYETSAWFSEALLDEIKSKLPAEHIGGFKDFVKKNWG